MIRLLTKDVADKIAAGEVIERPVSVIKELLENSIDAGASSIDIEIKKGGLAEIRITDNGSGIAAGEVEVAFLRHATSKIEQVEDLKKIQTLGFRGEALASIAAVARVELITRTEDEKVGTRLVIHGGEVISNSSVGCPKGTTIIVRDLFYNTPVRAAFVKSEGVEAGMIIDQVSRLAVAVPDIRIRLISNERDIFTTSGNGNIHQAILAVYKERELKDLIPLQYADDCGRVYGYISKPSLSRTSRRSQYFFVNGRSVRNAAIEKGLALGYRERLFEGRYPIAFLFLEIDPGKIDVNIHPNKREIRFSDDVEVSKLVSDGVEAALLSDDAVIGGLDNVHLRETKLAYEPVSDAGIRGEYVRAGGSKLLNREEKQMDVKELLGSVERIKKAEVPEPECATEQFDTVPPENTPFDFDNLTFGSIIFNTYITATDDTYFYMFDQHAAHERINYEKFVSAYRASDKASQILMLPFTFDVPFAMANDDEEWTEALRAMGYELDKFGDNTYICRSVPSFISQRESEDFISAFVEAFYEGEKMDHKVVIDKLITKSCKASIKAHDVISREELVALMNDLAKCRNPFSCPHGRPTFVRFSIYEIKKMFLRVV